MIYYVLLFCVVCFSLVIVSKSENNKKTIIMSFGILAFFSGFRYYVGVDYDTYVKFFNLINLGYHDIKIEKSFKILAYLIGKIGGSSQCIFVIFAIITCYFYYKYIIKSSDDIIMSFVIYWCLGPLYFSSFNTMREACAIAIIMYAINYLDISLKKYYLLCIVASLIHISALAFFLFPLIKYADKKYINNMIAISAIMIIGVRLKVLDRVVLLLFPKYERYLYVHQTNMDSSYVLFLIVNIIIVIFSVIKFDEFDYKFAYLNLLSGTMIFVALVGKEYTTLFTRIISYTTPAIMINVPIFKKFVKPRWIVDVVVYMVCIGYYFYIITHGRAMLPYQMNFLLF